MDLVFYSGSLFLVFVCLFMIWKKQTNLHEYFIRMQTYIENSSLKIDRLTQDLGDKAKVNEDIIRTLSSTIDKQLGEGRENQQNTLHQLQQRLLERFAEIQKNLAETLGNNSVQLQRNLSEFKEHMQNGLNQQRTSFDEHQINSLKTLQESLHKGMQESRAQLTESLKLNADTLGQRVDKLTRDTDQRLKEISGQVERRLAEGFEKTTATFTDVIKRLALIDEAQKKITELSGNVVSLQQVLVDKRARGAFGEVQLAALVRNVMPESSFSFQHTLRNKKRADCILFLPEPTGNLVIDAKFPLETFHRLQDNNLPASERRQAEQQFRQDIRKHIQDISEKYILPGETADGAMMFIPAEAVFAEIHAHYPDLVEQAQRACVWLVSPTTMMAVLTTARAVLKDAATRKQIHVIQEHLVYLSKDFDRFQQRMDNLSRHIGLAYSDIEQVHTSAQKITRRFHRIEKVELQDEEKKQALLEEV